MMEATGGEHQSTSSLLASWTSEKKEDDLDKNMQPDSSVGEAENSSLPIERSAQFTFTHISNNEKLVRLYTGFYSSAIFFALFNLMKNIPLNYYEGGTLLENIDKMDQLLMTLMKLRQNFEQEDLAVRFNVSHATVTNIIITWIHALHEVLFKQLMAKIPSSRKNQSCLVNSPLKNCRIILDFSEVETTLPWNPVRKLKAVDISDETRYTWKFLVALAPNGTITYVSNLYPGLRSNKKVTVNHCGILEQLQPGDLVLTDDGFILQNLFPPGVNSNIQTKSIPEAGILFEKTIRRMKRYKILNSIPHSLRTYGSTIVQLVGALTNFQPLCTLQDGQEGFSSESDNE